MLSRLRFAVPTLALVATTLAGLAASTARADDCDYVGRHYKTDLQPVGVTTYPASRDGDIFLSPSVRITVQNVGLYAIADTAAPGSLIHARRVAVAIKGRTFYGWLPAPFNPGARADVSVSIPDGFLGVCESTTATIDADNTLGQYGCQVKANDTIKFTAFFNPRLCVIIHRPFPTPLAAEDAVGAAGEASVGRADAAGSDGSNAPDVSESDAP